MFIAKAHLRLFWPSSLQLPRKLQCSCSTKSLDAQEQMLPFVNVWWLLLHPEPTKDHLSVVIVALDYRRPQLRRTYTPQLPQSAHFLFETALLSHSKDLPSPTLHELGAGQFLRLESK